MPLPDSAQALRASAALGARVAALLDPDEPVVGVTTGDIEPALRIIAVPSKRGEGAMSERDRDLTAGWGHAGQGGAVMPGQGRWLARDYDLSEAAANAGESLGARTRDVFLNEDAYWRNLPDAVWDFAIGGYQVLKKWPSYRSARFSVVRSRQRRFVISPPSPVASRHCG